MNRAAKFRVQEHQHRSNASGNFLVTLSKPVRELPSKLPEEHMKCSAPRGRGAPRRFARGLRSRGLGLRGFSERPSAGGFETQSREIHFEPRGHGRGRGGFSRGRATAFTDHREFDRSVDSDRVGPGAGYQKEAPTLQSNQLKSITLNKPPAFERFDF
ncbi:hypothetical protein CRM22_000303 [Opisthorchis felineus]|uniref:Uncharacterized protein n=1 Tax=Opisthorchis felineus TaxID=147828 RepID=A0A4V6RH94_OPIFE|nr:hypothetical protein CRM22_000303 [Opisthorchis felineus]